MFIVFDGSLFGLSGSLVFRNPFRVRRLCSELLSAVSRQQLSCVRGLCGSSAPTVPLSDSLSSVSLSPDGRDAPVLVRSVGRPLARPRVRGSRCPPVHGGGPAGDPEQQQPEVHRQ